MEKDTYLSLAKSSEGFYKEKGSKFLAFAFPVSSEEEIKEKILVLKKEYYDARHHCYAYILGKDATHYRANDDGEPGHSAGDPILGQIRSHHLTDVLIVVVRYFGGTKLGVGGLIHAYKTAAADAIANNTIVKKIVTASIKIHFEYLSMNSVMKLIKDYDLKIVEQIFDNQCFINFSVREKLRIDVVKKLKEMSGVEVEK